jgi:AAA15 family ATPase/GTPase
MKNEIINLLKAEGVSDVGFCKTNDGPLPYAVSVVVRLSDAVVDEIENSMHPMLIYKLLKYFFNSESKGQLICTTHLTLLRDHQELVRPYELWKVEKENGNSVMTSFNDYKIHNTMNIRKGYEEGRYGGVPRISNIE